MASVIKAGLVYFAVVFSVGFALAPLRELWAIPTFGARVGELLEFPLMLVAIVVAATWLNRRFLKGRSPFARIAAGVLALSCMLAAELAVVFRVRELSLAEYIADRDPIAGSVYLMMLAVFALMPWLLGRVSPSR